MRNVDRVWYERGDWKDITEETLQQQLASSEDNIGKPAATDTETTSLEGDRQLQKQTDKDGKLGVDQDEHNVDLGKLRDSVISKLQ
jgi:hypothetical protein